MSDSAPLSSKNLADIGSVPQSYQTTLDSITALSSAVNQVRLGGGIIWKVLLGAILLNASLDSCVFFLSHVLPLCAGIIGIGTVILDLFTIGAVVVFAFKYPRTAIMDPAELIIDKGQRVDIEPLAVVEVAPVTYIELQ